MPRFTKSITAADAVRPIVSKGDDPRPYSIKKYRRNFDSIDWGHGKRKKLLSDKRT